MHRNARREVGARIFTCLGILLVMPATASALPLISEVFYDAVGSDDGQGFVELYGTPGTDLSGLTIEGINGTGGSVTVSIPMPVPRFGALGRAVPVHKASCVTSCASRGAAPNAPWLADTA